MARRRPGRYTAPKTNHEIRCWPRDTVTLRKTSFALEAVDGRVRALVDELVDTMRDNNGVGLAAPQVGVRQRIVALVDEHDQVVVYINPVISQVGDEQLRVEGCLSVPNIYAEIPRWARCHVEALDRSGNRFEQDLTGHHAHILQHEVDHLDGVLMVDLMTNQQYNSLRNVTGKSRMSPHVTVFLARDGMVRLG